MDAGTCYRRRHPLLTPDGVAVELDAFEVVARMRAIPLPFDSSQCEGGDGGGQIAGIDAWGRLWAPVYDTGGGTLLLTPARVLAMISAPPLPFDAPPFEGGGGGKGEVTDSAATSLLESTIIINAWGRLWTPRHVTGRSISLLTPARVCQLGGAGCALAVCGDGRDCDVGLIGWLGGSFVRRNSAMVL